MNKKERFLSLLETNENIGLILRRVSSLNLSNWYLGAGGVTQTIWNALHGFSPENGIKDYDLVYYSAEDISYETEDEIIQQGKILFRDIPIPVEIINEARVHLWYEKRFGVQIKPYKSIKDAISSWPTTATSIGVTYNDGKFSVYAPYGLDDLLAMVVRPNKVQITKEIYEDKANRWAKIWPQLKIIPW